MKKILMVGAGIGQIYLSKKIKQRGDYLITVTLPGHQPVIEIADKVCYCDVFDKTGVLRIAQQEGIDAVISDQNDTMMPTVAFVAENMNLPGLRIAQMEAYCNKNHYRDNCDKLGIPVPKHVEVHELKIPAEFSYVPFPWIVKPADSQSSVGVEKVYNEEEYVAALEKAISYSKTKSAILEEFFNGQELVAEGFIYQGRYYNLGFADRKYFKLNRLFIPSQTIFPSNIDKDLLAKIEDYEQQMAGYIKPEFAIVHSEYLYNPQTREIRVVESALRGGGVYISSHLIPLYSGIDINEILLDCICGKHIDMNAVMSRRNNKAAGYVCFYLPEGTIINVEGMEEAAKQPFIKMMCVDDVKVGNTTPALTHKGQRLGPIIVTGENRADIEKNIAFLQNNIKVTVRNSKGSELGIIWN